MSWSMGGPRTLRWSAAPTLSGSYLSADAARAVASAGGGGYNTRATSWRSNIEHGFAIHEGFPYHAAILPW